MFVVLCSSRYIICQNKRYVQFAAVYALCTGIHFNNGAYVIIIIGVFTL